ncbi:MAG: type III toxin-antitoxin system ToxN/AbiQ family toxin [Lachnospiraceae bacterium]|nr:type III toxin-antitoxin system ToxN/AbiQ family toxin [Lachnospiraceae bacterium]
MLKIYTVDTDYNDYLMQFDINVKLNSGDKENRPYIGVLFEINKLKYFAPMASPRPKHKRMRNSIDFEKIKNGQYGAINFNNMIPVKEKNISLIDINNIQDLKYKILLINQYNYINLNSKRLKNKAKNLYNLIINNRADNKLKIRCANYLLLEEKCKLYIPEFYIYQDKEQGKLVVFTEEKTEDRYNLYSTIKVPKDQIGTVKEVKQLSDLTTFALIDENNKNKSFYSTISKKVYETIDKLNEATQSIIQ